MQIFREIHPEWAHETQLFEYQHLKGWIMPYFIGRTATDAEISQKIIDIYQRTGRIILDAPVKQNFICTPYDEVICIDVGFAFQIYSNPRREPSFTSLNQWQNFKHQFNYDFFHRSQKNPFFSQTVHTIKSLIFLQKHLPNLKDCQFLFDHPSIARYLSNCYDKGDNIPTYELKVTLEHIEFHSFEQVQKRCIQNFMNYLELRCLIDEHFLNFKENPRNFSGELKLSWYSYLFLDRELTLQKIKWAQRQIQYINNCQNHQELKRWLHRKTFKNSSNSCISFFSSQLNERINSCQTQLTQHSF